MSSPKKKGKPDQPKSKKKDAAEQPKSKSKSKGKSGKASPTGEDDRRYRRPIFQYEEQRRQTVKFGKGDVQFVVPSNYPDEKAEAKREVEGDLIMEHVYGYKGCTNNARQNLYVRENLLIYYIAAVGVVHDTSDDSQKFFTLHNDDITCLTVDPREGSTIVATGQKDPKDEPGRGKDYPKIWLWNYKTMQEIALIDDVCWGQVDRLLISPLTGFLYVFCGDKDQTMKVYDLDAIIKSKKKKVLSKDVEMLAVPSQNTKKIGFLVRPFRPKNDQLVDEVIIYCKDKLQHVTVTWDPKNKKKLAAKFRAVSVNNLNKKGEKAFLCGVYLPNSARYLVGGVGGNVYLCEGPTALNMQKKVHKDGVYGLCLGTGGTVYSAGDPKEKNVKGWKVDGDREKGDFMSESYDSGAISVQGSDFVMSCRTLEYQDPGTIIIGSKSNQIASWNLDKKVGKLLVDGHDGQVHSISTHPTDDLFITGGWDRALKVWDAKTRKCLATYEFALNGDPWTWQRKQDDGKEEDNKEERKPIKDSWQFVTSSWEESGKLFAVGTETSAIAIFQFQRNPVRLNLLTCFKIPPKSENAEEEAVSVVAFNKDASMLAVAHMDSNVYIYCVESKGASVKLTPFKKPVSNRAAPSHLQWSDDSSMVQVLTRDYEIARFFVDKDQKTIVRCVKIPDPDKFKWYGDPLLTGWETKGCLQKEMDGTDINDVTVSSDKKLVACGDDYGHVRLHNFPVVLQQPNKCYSGHAEHVVGVEFMGNDNYLISCGGADFAIFQWAVKKGY